MLFAFATLCVAAVVGVADVVTRLGEPSF